MFLSLILNEYHFENGCPSPDGSGILFCCAKNSLSALNFQTKKIERTAGPELLRANWRSKNLLI